MRVVLLVVAVLTFMPCAAWAQGDPVGPEFRVNTYTTTNQRYPSIAKGGSGDFVVVWSSSVQDGSLLGVFGQRYAGSGVQLGPEFRVNTYTTGSQVASSVAADASGNFVVVWQGYGQDGSGFGIFGQRYDNSGAPLGPEFRVNSYTASSQIRPSVAVDGVGSFVVVWWGPASTFGYDIFGQRYASSGAPLGREFRVNTYPGMGPLGSYPRASVSSDSSGDFVVVWEGNYGTAISGQRYSSAGVPLGSEFFVVLSCLPCSNVSPSVASDSAGDFVVVWATGLYAFNEIAGRRYSSSGAAGSQFRVSTYEAAYQSDPAVASDASGNFVVVWRSEGQDGSTDGVFGQRFLGSGPKSGPEFRVNTYTPQAQKDAAVAADALGNFVVTWGSNAQDGSSYGVFGQRFNMIVPVELMRFGVD